MSEKKYYLRARVIRFEDKAARLELSDGQTINWPIKNLPDEIVVGQEIRLNLKTEASEEIERQETAKEILNQLLSG